MRSTVTKSLPVFQVYAANTDVGKTVFSTSLCRGAMHLWRTVEKSKHCPSVFYIKPVQTGFPHDSDARHVKTFCDGVDASVLFTYKEPLSPHLTAIMENKIISDEALLTETKIAISRAIATSNNASSIVFVETAGGVHSPAPSGTSQAAVFRPLRLPTVLVGDSRLGGISTTLTAYESLQIKGYDIPLVLLFDDKTYANHEIIKRNIESSTNIVTVPRPPPVAKDDKLADATSMMVYYESLDEQMAMTVRSLVQWHCDRITRLDSLTSRAQNSVWWPFTQHKTVERTTAIDSAFRDNFEVYQEANGDNSKSVSQTGVTLSLFDSCASWWTQCVGHANPAIAMAAAKASGRYGHVIFPECAHEPSVELAERLIATAGKGWASRCFFSDNGSTATEVAIKMALRRAEVQRSDVALNTSRPDLKVIGIDGSYHGDTIGSMNASGPNVYNKQVNWYKPNGLWFEPPTIVFKNGNHVLRLPKVYAAAEGATAEERVFASTSSIFSRHRDQDKVDENLRQMYRSHIDATLNDYITRQKMTPGCLIIEPVLMGAGGMLFVDPLFQRTLISTVRDLHLHYPDLGGPLPVIFDEVFVGLHRLGLGCTSPGAQLLGVLPDVACYAKSLSAGLVPLAATLATEEVFNSFKGDSKASSLLHGHSYTAHPVGCAVALEGFNIMESLLNKAGSNAGHVWDVEIVNTLSFLPNVEGVVCLGTVLAVELATAGDGRGYTATSSSSAVAKTLREKHHIFVRPIGNVVYIMISHTTPATEANRVLEAVLETVRNESSTLSPIEMIA